MRIQITWLSVCNKHSLNVNDIPSQMTPLRRSLRQSVLVGVQSHLCKLRGRTEIFYKYQPGQLREAVSLQNLLSFPLFPLDFAICQFSDHTRRSGGGATSRRPIGSREDFHARIMRKWAALLHKRDTAAVSETFGAAEHIPCLSSNQPRNFILQVVRR